MNLNGLEVSVHHQLHLKLIQHSQPSFSWQQLPAIHHFVTSWSRSCIWTFVRHSHAVRETIHSLFSTYSSFDPLQHLATCVPQHKKCISLFKSLTDSTASHPLQFASLSLEASFHAICHRCGINSYLCAVLSFRQEQLLKHQLHLPCHLSHSLKTYEMCANTADCLRNHFYGKMMFFSLQKQTWLLHRLILFSISHTVEENMAQVMKVSQMFIQHD